MEELKEALKKTKSGKSPDEVTWILNCINMQKTHFMGDYWFFKLHLYDGRNARRMEKLYYPTYIQERWQTKGGKL